MAAPKNSGRSPAVRQTQYGPIEGVDDAVRSGTYYWLGVPYAKPPVGALRWRAPQDPSPWTSRISTTVFANACVQYGTRGGPGANNAYDTSIAALLNQTVGSEDCLYLNIWRPANDAVDLPVIVFLHGGYNVSGYTADPMYNGANLARVTNAVIVTVGYRLGVFGWLSLPQLKIGSADNDSGNFGTLDTVKALEWVNHNIEEFGGSAHNVTIMGQSAGAINAWALMVAAPTRNATLFHRLIALSGGISLASNLPAGSLPCLFPAPYYAAQGIGLLHNLVIADGEATDEASAAAYVATLTSSQVADYLRAQKPATILTILLTKLLPMGLGVSGPIPDGAMLPTDPIASISKGAYAMVPVLAGNTRDEGKLFGHLLALSPALGGASGYAVSDAERFLMEYNFDPDGASELNVASLISARYLPVQAPETGYNVKTALLSNIFMFANRDNILNTLKTRQPNIWHYQFDWAQEPAPWNDVYGAAHEFDLLFIFGNFGPSVFANVIGGNANRHGRIALSEAMMASIAAFARNGDPNNDSLGVAWPTWPKKLVFDANLTDKTIRVE